MKPEEIREVVKMVFEVLGDWEHPDWKHTARSESVLSEYTEEVKMRLRRKAVGDAT